MLGSGFPIFSSLADTKKYVIPAYGCNEIIEMQFTIVFGGNLQLYACMLCESMSFVNNVGLG